MDRGWCTSAVDLAGGAEKAVAAKPEAGRGHEVDVATRSKRGPEAPPRKGGCDRDTPPQGNSSEGQHKTCWSNDKHRNWVPWRVGTVWMPPGERIVGGKGLLRPAKTTAGSVAHQQEKPDHRNVKSEGGTTSNKTMTHSLPILYHLILPSRHIPSPRPSGREGTLA